MPGGPVTTSVHKVTVKLLSRVRLCDPMDCSPPGSSVPGILQARILEWVAISFSKKTQEALPSYGGLGTPGGGSLSPAHVTLLGSETASESDSICLHLPSFGVCAHAHIKDPRASGSPGVTGRLPQPLSFVNDPKGLDQWGLCSADSEGSRRGRKQACPRHERAVTASPPVPLQRTEVPQLDLH